MTTDVRFDDVKHAVLAHIESVFEEGEHSLAMQHQEKYSMLEDAFESATDVSELRIAFEQWHMDHAEDLNLEENPDELWSLALARVEEYDDEDDSDEEEIDDLDEEDEDADDDDDR